MRYVWSGLCALLAGAAACLPAAAQDAPRSVLFVIDGSGSMWGRFETPQEKRAKIDVVRELVRPLIANDTRTRIGLQSYGHRRRSDCSDVEVLAPPSGERTALMQALDKLNPRGKGPLAETLRQAGQAIGTERPASVIVINDGMDNCRQDACAAATDFAKAAPGVPVHMISIGIDPGDHPSLQCVAKATGGTFFDARDPVLLTAAIGEAASLAFGTAPGASAAAAADTQAGPQKPLTPEQAAAALPAAPLRATVALTAGMKPLDKPVTWQIFKGAGDKSGGEAPLRTITADAIAENLEPGTYTLRARLDDLTAQASVTVEAGRSETLALAFNAGRIIVKTKAAQGAAPIVAIAEASGGKTPGRTVHMTRTQSLDAALPPATYVVSVTTGEIRQERQITLAEGNETVAEFDVVPGTLSLSAAASEGGPRLSDVTFSILEDDPDSPDGRREVRRARGPDPRFTLPPGTYYAAARSQFAETRQRLALSAGDTLEKTIVLAAAEVKLVATVSGAPPPETAGLVFRIVALDADTREIARVAAPQFSGLLNAGRYRVTATLERHGAGIAQDILVEAGKPLTRVLDIAAGEVTMKGLAPGTPDAFWEVRNEAGLAIWHSSAAQPRVLLAPGRYSMRMEARDKSVEAAFAVTAGGTTTIELGAR